MEFWQLRSMGIRLTAMNVDPLQGTFQLWLSVFTSAKRALAGRLSQRYAVGRAGAFEIHI